MFEQMEIAEQVYERKSPSKTLLGHMPTVTFMLVNKKRRIRLAYQPREGLRWQAQDKKGSLYEQEDDWCRKKCLLHGPGH